MSKDAKITIELMKRGILPPLLSHERSDNKCKSGSKIGHLYVDMGIDLKRCSECEYKNRPSIRDDLLVTAGARAAYMYNQDVINLPEGIVGEHQLADLLSRVVDEYLYGNFGNFDNWIETALMQTYGKKGE